MKFVLKVYYKDFKTDSNIEEIYVSDKFDNIMDILKNVDYVAYELFYVPDYVRLW